MSNRRMPAQVKNTHKQNTVHLTDMLGFFGVVFLFILFVSVTTEVPEVQYKVMNSTSQKHPLHLICIVLVKRRFESIYMSIIDPFI